MIKTGGVGAIFNTRNCIGDIPRRTGSDDGNENCLKGVLFSFHFYDVLHG